MLYEYNAQEMCNVFKFYFDKSNQTAMLSEYDLGISLSGDYEERDLMIAILRELKRTNSSLFI